MKKIFYTIFISALCIMFIGCKDKCAGVICSDGGTCNEGVCSNEVVDIDGNRYGIKQIGTYKWMTENLKVTHYNNGDPIPTGLSNSEWYTTSSGAYHVYDDATYGKLYNWYAVNDSRKLCPEGWRIPTTGEWQSLISYLGGQSVAGGKLKSITQWVSPNTGATNSSGFTAMPGGLRRYDGPTFGFGQIGLFWSKSTTGSTAFYFELLSYQESITQYDTFKESGFSCRCIQN